MTKRLREVESKNRELIDNVKKLGRLKLTKDKAGRRRDAMDAASARSEKVTAAMAAAAPQNNVQAMDVLDPPVAELIGANLKIERTIRELKPKKRRKKVRKKKK